MARAVLPAWQAQQLPVDVISFLPVTPDDLALAHDPAFVAGVLSGQIPNGFGNCLPAVARTLPYTTGAMLAAARHALAHGIGCAPVCGFHHAHYDSIGGFCTFNGLVVTSIKLLTEGLVRRVMILDCDQHFGDGTDQILARLALFDSIENASFGRWYKLPEEASSYLRKLRNVLETLPEYDLVLYQAGVDVHVDDPLGGVLTTKEIIARDRMVFSAARQAGVPIAWNLAGGYQKPVSKVVALHVNTMRECVAAYTS